MSQYSVAPAIMSRLREIPELTNAVITEDYTSPSVCRPVLQPIVSVGVKEMVMEPVTRYSHKITAVARLTMLFPCGLEDSDISETVYKVSAAFTGRVYNYLLVERVTASDTQFNSQMYGVRVELDLHMRSTANVTDLNGSGTEIYSIGNIQLDRMPDRIAESRQKLTDGEMSASPRVFTLEGSSATGPVAGHWRSLHELMAKDGEFEFNLPRSEKTVAVKPLSIETEGDLCGHGFSYKLVLQEVL